jgi:hypothetical protein
MTRPTPQPPNPQPDPEPRPGPGHPPEPSPEPPPTNPIPEPTPDEIRGTRTLQRPILPVFDNIEAERRRDVGSAWCLASADPEMQRAVDRSRRLPSA